MQWAALLDFPLRGQSSSVSIIHLEQIGPSLISSPSPNLCETQHLIRDQVTDSRQLCSARRASADSFHFRPRGTPLMNIKHVLNQPPRLRWDKVQVVRFGCLAWHPHYPPPHTICPSTITSPHLHQTRHSPPPSDIMIQKREQINTNTAAVLHSHLLIRAPISDSSPWFTIMFQVGQPNCKRCWLPQCRHKYFNPDLTGWSRWGMGKGLRGNLSISIFRCCLNTIIIGI